MSQNYQFFPGRIKISNVIISNGTDTADITELFKELNLNSSVGNMTVTAEFVISDAVNFLHHFRPNAGDTITIDIGYFDFTKYFSFKIVDVRNIAEYQRQRAYVLNCVSNFYYKGMYKEVNGALKGTTSSIARGIFEENTDFEKVNIWEESVGSEKIVFPKWSVNESMKWLARRSAWKNDNVRMKFFQDSNLKYNFMPIEKAVELYKDQPIYRYVYNLVAGTIGKDQLPNTKDTLAAVKDITFHDKQFDIIQALNSGKIAGVRYAPDIVNKQYNPISYNYFDQFNPDLYLNKLPQFNKFNFESGINQYDVNTSFTQPEVSDLNKISDASNIKRTNVDLSQVVDIEVVGNPIIDIGQVIQLDISSPEPVSQNRDSKIDKRFSGKYYVYSKRDVFNEDIQKMALTLVKESQIGF